MIPKDLTRRWKMDVDAGLKLKELINDWVIDGLIDKKMEDGRGRRIEIEEINQLLSD